MFLLFGEGVREVDTRSLVEVEAPETVQRGPVELHGASPVSAWRRFCNRPYQKVNSSKPSRANTRAASCFSMKITMAGRRQHEKRNLNTFTRSSKATKRSRMPGG